VCLSDIAHNHISRACRNASAPFSDWSLDKRLDPYHDFSSISMSSSKTDREYVGDEAEGHYADTPVLIPGLGSNT
jgi:hypothetical protein